MIKSRTTRCPRTYARARNVQWCTSSAAATGSQVQRSGLPTSRRVPRHQKDPKPTRSRRRWEENHSGNTRRVKPFNAAQLTEPPHCQLWSYCKITLKFTVCEWGHKAATTVCFQSLDQHTLRYFSAIRQWHTWRINACHGDEIHHTMERLRSSPTVTNRGKHLKTLIMFRQTSDGSNIFENMQHLRSQCVSFKDKPTGVK